MIYESAIWNHLEEIKNGMTRVCNEKNIAGLDPPSQFKMKAKEAAAFSPHSMASYLFNQYTKHQPFPLLFKPSLFITNTWAHFLQLPVF